MKNILHRLLCGMVILLGSTAAFAQTLTVATDPATNIGQFGATGNGTVNPGGGTVSVFFEFGSGYSTQATPATLSGNTPQTVSASIPGPYPYPTGQIVSYRVRVQSGISNYYGAYQSFTTLPSNNAGLQSLTLANDSMGQSPIAWASVNGTSYTAPMQRWSKTTVYLSIIPAQVNATVQLNGNPYTPGPSGTPVTLDNVGNNVFNIEITAQDRDTKTTYTVTIPRSAPQPGDIDTTFGTNGQVSGVGLDVVVQPDDKFIVVGNDLRRYNADGKTLDTNFDTDGVVSVSGGRVALQNDGNVLVLGNSLFRYMADGTPDGNFGTSGSVSDPLAGVSPADMAVDSNGNIMVSGLYFVGNQPWYKLTRYLANGTRDPNFGNSGFATRQIGAVLPFPSIYGRTLVAMQGTDIIVVGPSYDGTSSTVSILRFNTLGVLDASFGNNGLVTRVAGSAGGASRLLIQDNGDIFIGGYYMFSFSPIAFLTSISKNGDQGGGGFSPGPFLEPGGHYLNGMARMRDGRIVSTGTISGGATSDFFVARINPNDPDTSFGYGTGITGTRLASGTMYAQGVAVQSDGSIVVVGTADSGVGIVRYVGGPLTPVLSAPAPTGITTTGATLNGTVNANGSVTTAQFEYGLTTSYGSTAPITLVPNNGTSTLNVSAPISGLTASTTYYYRITASNGNGTAVPTTDRTFTTLSTNANLTGLTPSAGTLSPTFSSNTLAYSLSVQSGIGSITLRPVVAQANATVTVNGAPVVSGSNSAPITVPVGGTTVNVVVTAQDGVTSKTYTVAVTPIVLSTNANLARLILSTGGVSPAFSSATLSYTAVVPNATTSITVTPVVTDATATVTVKGTAVASGSASAPISLVVGNNTIATVVTAQDGTTKKTYTVVVKRSAKPGTLDTTFNGAGSVVTQIGSGDDVGMAVALQSNQKIVVAGYSQNGTSNDFAVARYNSDGSPDPGFGNFGTTTTNIGGNDYGLGIAVQSNDQKILVAGYAEIGSYSNFALARYDTQGLPDIAFGINGDGIVTTSIGRDCYGQSVAVQANQKIVVAGYAYNSFTFRNEFALVRYKADGTEDTTFGTGGNGAVFTSFGADDYGKSVLIQPDQKIVVGGYSSGKFAIARYTSMGALDITFNGTGKVTTAINSGAYGQSLALQSDGKIVLAGYSGNGGQNFFTVARYNSDGTLDSTFGTAGKVTTYAGTNDEIAYSVALQPDQKFVVAGFSNNQFALVRYNANGVLDTSFGTSGISSANIGGSSAQGVAVQADGSIVAAGYMTQVPYAFALARFTGGPLTPVVTTQTASGVLNTSATLNGVVNPAGATTTAQFEYGLTTSYGNVAPVTISPGNGTTGQSVAATIAGLSPTTSYHYRITATNSAGVATGVDQTFTTFNGLSNNANLANLLLSAGLLSPAFDSATTNYAISTPDATTSTTVTPTVADGTATVAVNGSAVTSGAASQNINLNPGTNPISVVVIAQDGTAKTYVVTVTRLFTQQTWRQAYFGTTSNTGDASDDADPDKDGIKNIMEWVLNLTPNSPSASPVAVVKNGTNLEYTFPRSVAAVNAGTPIVVEWTDTLAPTDWQTTGVTQTVLSDDGVVQQVKATLPVGTNSRRYVRLRVGP